MGLIVLLHCLCQFVALVWGNPTSVPIYSTSTATSKTTGLLNSSSLSNVDSICVINRTETTITLQWNKVDNDTKYNYNLTYNNQSEYISGLVRGSVVTYSVLDLTAGTEYNFILYTVLEEARSTGYNFTNVTAPPSVANISINNHNETALILEWNKVNNNSNYNYILSYNNQNESVSGSEGGFTVTYIVQNLTAGTEYSFTLYTVFQGVHSAGFPFTAVTTPHSVANISIKNHNETELILEWYKVSNNSNYNYILSYNNQNESVAGSEGGFTMTYTVQNLTAGTEYSFTLYTVFKGVHSAGFPFTAVTTPHGVTNISINNHNETVLILEWNKVNNNSNYNYTLSYCSQNVSICGFEEGSTVIYSIPDLTAGTEYNFLLYTVFKGVLSAGFPFTAVTTPNCVTNTSIKNRNETVLILEWNKVNNNFNYSYILSYNRQNASISGSGEGSAVTYTVPNLIAGTEYNFTLYTVFKGVQSAGFPFAAVTIPHSVTTIYVKNYTETTLKLEWNKVNNNNIYNYRLNYNSKNVSLSGSEDGSAVTYTVIDLIAGTTYTFSLYTVFKDVESRAYNITRVTVPNSVTGLNCQYSSGGYGLTLVWDPANGARTAVQVNISRTSFSHTGETLYIDGLLPAQWYTLTVSALSGSMKSVPVSVTCQTDPRGVIAGVLTFLLLAILILCIGIFIGHHKPDCVASIFSKFKPSNESKWSSNKYKPILLKKFPMHFSSLSCDQNHGFSEEYEELSNVGTNQSCTVAKLPENKSKNRYTNVLAYDSSRVKLATKTGSDSDYINANYIHGYDKKNKQYIAAQGPLPSTVNDFWRMVWEQRSSAIVMLTNCIEGGKNKCEHYWPMNYMPCLYGKLWVSLQSEQIEGCWTRREFIIKNESASEEHAVTHFHFTAWPDHGVPRGTEDLIQFRWIVHQHIEAFPFGGPIVVHCSAGVGRTGTLIALDVLLQQMDKEQVVNIADFVRRMRLSRPLMVQTQVHGEPGAYLRQLWAHGGVHPGKSQYVFLHQCIMDSLQPKDDSTPEPLYENSDMIYDNALVLRECEAGSSG